MVCVTHSLQCYHILAWAARYNTWLLIKLTLKGVVFSFLFFLFKTSWHHRAAGVPSTPGRPLIDFSKELPLPAALAVPAGGHGGPGSIQPQSIKLALEASDMMLANKERDANKVGSARSALALWLLLCTWWWCTMSTGMWPCTTA